MSTPTVSQVVARTNAAIVESDLDVTGALAALLTGAVESLPATEGAILVELDGVLDVLAATSHRVRDLELVQAQVEEGPCLDAIRTGASCGAIGPAVSRRWPRTGPAIERAGYTAVHATPLRWQGQVFGALNFFRVEPTDLAPLERECRALADAVTLVVVAGHLDVPRIFEGLRAALEERAVVEQAKGALAHMRSLPMPDAFEALLSLAREERVTLGVAARTVMERARAGQL